MGEGIKWVHGFLGGDKAITFPQKSLAEDLLRCHEELPFPLNLHINSLFQFYIVPLVNLIALNAPENFKGSTPTIWFNGFREMQSILPYDFKFWGFTGKKVCIGKKILFLVQPRFFYITPRFGLMPKNGIEGPSKIR